jgi:hypothetical protein
LQRPVLGMALVAPEAAHVTSIQDKARRRLVSHDRRGEVQPGSTDLVL